MKCPKCGYLGFEPVDRCRNCGYDFSLAPSVSLSELAIRNDQPDEVNLLDDLALIDAASPGAAGPAPSPDRERYTDVAPLPTPGRSMDRDDRPARAERPHFLSTRSDALEAGLPMAGASRDADGDHELPLFGQPVDDTPLITRASPPRQPLAVRRATPDVPRIRPSILSQARAPMLDLAVPDAGEMDSPSVTPAARVRVDEWIAPLRDDKPQAAGVVARVAAAAIDVVVLALIDLLVVYLTLEMCGLSVDDLSILPRGPMLAFLLALDGGYLVAFTVGGQTLGKMALGIRVVPARSHATLDLGHAIVRTVVWAALAIPAGLGFVTALFSDDRRGLHDRCAGTKVVRASAS